jgi:hypothetical protein
MNHRTYDAQRYSPLCDGSFFDPPDLSRHAVGKYY